MKKKIKRILSFLLFCMITLQLFLTATYLFRPRTYNRMHIEAMQAAAEDSIDVVYIGGSAAYVYWQPMKAWHDFGIASHLMATDTLQAEMIRYYMEEIQKNQTPDLYIVDVRPFQYWDPAGEESSFRAGGDFLKAFSFVRWKMVNAYLKNHTLPEGANRTSYYFDIIKYHTNQESLASPESWKNMYSEEALQNKGFEWRDAYEYIDAPGDFQTENCAELPSGTMWALEDLLAYCKSEDMQVLFVVCPYRITAEHQEIYNSLQKIIEDNGFQFLNTNLNLEKMNIDFSTDYYNESHVNCFGAEKYTAFLEEYIKDNYDIPDHRGESAYGSWDRDFERFSQEEQSHKETIRGLQAAASPKSF